MGRGDPRRRHHAGKLKRQPAMNAISRPPPQRWNQLAEDRAERLPRAAHLACGKQGGGGEPGGLLGGPPRAGGGGGGGGGGAGGGRRGAGGRRAPRVGNKEKKKNPPASLRAGLARVD